MFAPRAAAPKEIAPVAIAGYLQLAGLLIVAIAAREIESFTGPPGERPLMILALLTGAATFAGATLLRRHWEEATGPPPDARDEPSDARSQAAPAFSVRGRDEPHDADSAMAGQETWRRSTGIGSTDPRRAVERESDQAARVGAPR
jgi:hypothetical protein